jgi:hypothetical protein
MASKQPDVDLVEVCATLTAEDRARIRRLISSAYPVVAEYGTRLESANSPIRARLA